jgi:hypothetical protein
MQRLTRFARYWDLVANSGRFPATLPLLLADDPCARFLQFSDWLYAQTQQTHRIALPRLFALLHAALTSVFGLPGDVVLGALARDCAVHGFKGCPAFLHEHLRALETGASTAVQAPARQARHLRA